MKLEVKHSRNMSTWNEKLREINSRIQNKNQKITKWAKLKLNYLRIKWKMLNSSDVIRAYTEEIKQKCAISAIPLALAKTIEIYSPIAHHCIYDNNK